MTASYFSAQHILPSFLKRKGLVGKSEPSKKQKTVTSWDRDIICLPQTRKLRSQSTTNVISYPRKKYRAQLAAWGLIGKLHLTSNMSVADVTAEVRSVFRGPMSANGDFQFTFLQSTGGGSNTLIIPSTSSSYQWTAQQVSKLSTCRGTIYILAIDDLNLQCEVCTYMYGIIYNYVIIGLYNYYRRIVDLKKIVILPWGIMY